MCTLYINDGGTIITTALMKIPARNFVAPVLRGNSIIDSIKPIEDTISFIVDTGADVTCLSGLDAHRLNIEIAYLQPAQDVIGVSGACKTYKLDDVQIGLIDSISDSRITFHIEHLERIFVIDELKMTSLLGNDFLSRFDLRTERDKKTASLKRLSGASGEFELVSREIKRARPNKRSA